MSSRSQDNRTTGTIWLRDHLAELFLFLVANALLFIKLGIGEFESWDESHIVYRAYVIERFGAWLDQSPFALGGLYSSAHPPLGVWLMTWSRALLGPTEFATRLPAAMFGVLASCSIFGLLRLWATDRIALLLSAAFVTCSIFLWYARHAQLDSQLIALSLLSLTLYLYSRREASSKTLYLAGAVFGLALLTKFGWAFYILPFIIAHAALEERSLRPALLYVGIGLAIGASWYIYMLSTNDTFASSISRWLVGLSTEVNYETTERSVFYYINQLLIACPTITLLVVASRDQRYQERHFQLSLGWLVVVMLVLQLAVTKFPHFALMLLPPAFVLSAVAIGRNESRSLTWPVLTLLGITVAWSVSTQVRLLVRGVDFDLLFPPLVVVLPCILVLVLVGLYQWRTISLPYAIFTVILASIVMAAAIRVISYNEETFTDGARHIASRVFADPTVSKLFVVHAGLPHDSLTPRLAYYTQGWTSGWQEGRSVTKHTWYSPELVGELAQLPPKSAVILEREQDRFSRPSAEFIERYDSAVLILEQRFTERDSLRSYDLFYDR